MNKYLKRKVIEPIIGYLKEGVSPVKIAMCIGFGCVIGVVPIIGITTLLCAGIAVVFRLNIAIIQIINYAVYPLQIIFFIPFIKTGIYIFGATPLQLSADQIIEMIKENAFQIIMEMGYANFLGFIIWLFIAPVAFAVIYYSSYFVLKGYKLKE